MMGVEPTQELDELYAVYKSLIGKEIECTGKALQASTLEERNTLIDNARRFSREASALAMAIKAIEDGGKATAEP